MRQGFTLFELLLVIGIMGILAYLSVPLGFSFYRSQTVESVRSQLLETLGKARHNAVSQKYDSRYGVLISTTTGNIISNFTLYQGTSSASVTTNSSFNEVYVQPPNLTITATGSNALASGDINFSKLYGTTTATGTITITFSGYPESRAILIDSFGNAYKQ